MEKQVAIATLAFAAPGRRKRLGVLEITTVAKFMSENDKLARGLVAHRGWHYPRDSLMRPLENTLPAYERAWSAGVNYCECDVTLTRDGEIVLSHDDDLKRLALNPHAVTKDVSASTFKDELEFFPLKDGSRVPLLREVLHAAHRSGMGKKLVIEIKGKDEACARKISELLATNQGLHEHVALVMSFSIDSVRAFAETNPHRGKVLSMFLTVCRRGSKACYFDLDESAPALKLIKDSGVDGLYVEYHRSFSRDPRFVNLCSQVPIGVWQKYFFDPDHLDYAERLLDRGAKFVNTDFPDDFFPRSSM